MPSACKGTTENCYPSHALTHCTKQNQAQMSSKIKILWHVHTYLGRVIIFLPGLQFMGTNGASAQNASFKA